MSRWLRETANARVHATTGAVPAARLEEERVALQPIPAPWSGTVLRGGQKVAKDAAAAQMDPPPPIVGLQHPLSVYEALSLDDADDVRHEAARDEERDVHRESGHDEGLSH